jgi:hypothetical protein
MHTNSLIHPQNAIHEKAIHQKIEFRQGENRFPARHQTGKSCHRIICGMYQ